jgi:hypothetical protein
MNHDAQRFEIEVLDAQQSDLAGSLPDQRERFARNPHTGFNGFAQK